MAKGAAEVEVEAGVKMESRICGLCGLPFLFWAKLYARVQG